MQQFTHAIVLALNNKNWYAALAVALALPDICGWLENPDEKVGKRYSNWYNKNFKYTLIEKIPEEIRKEFRNEQKFFLTGEDCYSLRCAYLHSGIDDITKKPTKRVNHNDCQKEVNSNVLNRFIFCTPIPGNLVHCNQIRNNNIVALQLQVDEFCMDMCHSVRKWELEVANKNPVILNRMNQFLIIRDLSTGVPGNI